jgi:acyl dehydratase
MAIDYQHLKGYPVPKIEQAYDARDVILYALGVGLGFDPMDERQLRFVYEEDLAVMPTMATVLGYPGFWLSRPDTGVDATRVVHGEQGLVLHRPLARDGAVVGTTRVAEIVDKGPGKAALIHQERRVVDQASGELLATLTMTTFCRGQGGFGGPSEPADQSRPQPHAIPERSPDFVCDLPTLPQAAFLYRLNGDFNPLHVVPEVAQAAGFPRPILHGLCTYGVACHALLRSVCDYDPARLQRLDVRFAAPAFPGVTIRTEIWREAGGSFAFRAKAMERDAVVLNNGRADIAPD